MSQGMGSIFFISFMVTFFHVCNTAILQYWCFPCRHVSRNSKMAEKNWSKQTVSLVQIRAHFETFMISNFVKTWELQLSLYLVMLIVLLSSILTSQWEKLFAAARIIQHLDRYCFCRAGRMRFRTSKFSKNNCFRKFWFPLNCSVKDC